MDRLVRRLKRKPESATTTPPRNTFPCGIKQLHSPDRVTIDIVFVHGLTGDREKTWTATDEDSPWPQALLPQKLPTARILTFGYDAKIKDWKGVVSRNRIQNHSWNLLTSLASYREEDDTNALVRSNERSEPHLQAILDQTRGILFLGTPHHGSGLAQWAERMSRFVGVMKQTNSDIVKTLRSDSEVLARIQDSFHTLVQSRNQKQLNAIQITCCYEELPMEVVGIIVPQESATLPGYIPIGIHANHTEITKFNSLEDTGFKSISSELRRWIKDIDKERPLTQPESQRAELETNSNPACFHIPFSENSRFVGRAAILEQLKQIFFIDMSCRKAAIVGLGGVGKTQVVRQFMFWVKNNKPSYSIFWVPALSKASFNQACTNIMEACGIQCANDEDPKEVVKRYLGSKNAGEWLIVVDNADDIDLVHGSEEFPGGVYNYLPSHEAGLTLFTTRSRKVAVSVAQNNLIELSEMSMEEATIYLNQSLRPIDASANTIQDPHGMETLLKELAYLPLAITQAAAYMTENMIGIPEYLEIFKATEQDRMELMSSEFYDDTRHQGSQNAVVTTWLVSFQQIQRKDKSAAEILLFISCIEPKNIPRSILPQESTQQLTKAIGTLLGYGFLSKQKDEKFYEMHSLVHLATRVWASEPQIKERTWASTVSHLADIFPSDDWENRQLWRQYLPHALKLLESEPQLNYKWWHLQFWASQCLSANGQIPEAVKLLEVAVGIQKTTSAEDHPLHLATQVQLAKAYINIRRADKSIELLENVATIWKTMQTEYGFYGLVPQCTLAQAYLENGQEKKSIKLLEEVVKIQKITLSVDDPRYLEAQLSLAQAYIADAQVAKGINLLENAIKILKITLEEDNPYYLLSQITLARAYGYNLQAMEAIQLLEGVVEIHDKILAEDHPDRETSHFALANAYNCNGQVKEAIKLLEEVVRIQEKVFPKTDDNRLSSQLILGSAYTDDKQVRKAIQITEEVVTIRKMILAKDHPDYLISQHMLAKAYIAMGK